jgi:16S rRNA (cytosine1402-N4)-methyltransferase
MLKECIEALKIQPNGVYVDVTFGAGGHSREIIQRLDKGKLIAFDQDYDAVKNTEGFDKSKLIFVAANFRYLKKYLKLNGIRQVDGILADLGISSHQIDAAERGFSTRFEGELDMRMDRSLKISAKEIVNEYSEEQIAHILRTYGEVDKAYHIAKAIVRERVAKPIIQTSDLTALLNKFAPKGKEYKFYAQVFQALRIEVNDELKALEEMLVQSAEVLAPSGRLVVMSYHSLEDRLVKNFIKAGNFTGEHQKDFYGNILKPYKAVNNKPIEASDAEIALNRRARSAKLRIAEKWTIVKK